MVQLALPWQQLLDVGGTLIEGTPLLLAKLISNLILYKVEMAELVKIKGLKGKQNKKKWAKNIDVSGLLEAKARQHDQEIRDRFRQDLVVTDDNDKTRAPLDPNRFKQTTTPLPKKVYNNKITRDHKLKQAADVWNAPDEGRHIYKHPEIPSVIAPETGHSYNPRQEDIQKLKERIIDYESSKPNPRKVKAKTELPEVAIRHRNKKKRQAQLAARERKVEKQFKQQLHHIKKIKKAIEEKEVQIIEGIKTKKIKKEKQIEEEKTGRVRKGKKLGKKAYQFKQYIPEGEKEAKISRVSVSTELVRQRFDTIYRRGIFQPRNVKVHANRRKHIKVKERGFIE